jgi:hypothetical protein
MCSRMVLRRLAEIAPLLCIVLSACQSPTDANRQLDVAVSIDRLEITPSAPARVTLTIQNRGPNVVEVADPRSYACAAPYLVRDATDRPVQLPARTCLLILYAPRKLGPAESLTIQDQWSGDQSDGAGGATAVEPGKYRISAHVAGQGRQLTSETVTVSIPPAAP